MKSGLHLFIIWEKSIGKKDIILKDLEEKYIIREIFEIKWNENEFVKNLKRFYGNRLPNVSQKAELCGKGPFLLILVTDVKPKLEKVFLDDVNEIEINSNIFNSKMKYRKWIGEDYAIHGAHSEQETNHDLALLLGVKAENFEKELPKKWDGSIKKIANQELVGLNEWKNIKQFFDVLNATTNYVVLRNFEELPEKITQKDIDILTDDVETMSEIINVENNQSNLPIIIENKKISIDFRYQLGHHYEEKWSKDVLKRRILYKNIFYVPCDEDYFYTLLYHNNRTESKKYQKILNQLALKINIKENFKEILNDSIKSKKFMEKYMKQMGYKDTTTKSRTLFKIRNNELMRLVKVSIFLVKTYGIIFFLKKVNLKIKNTL